MSPANLSQFSRQSHGDGKALVSAPQIEIESVDQLSEPFWNWLGDYLVGTVGCTIQYKKYKTIYFDTARFDVSRAGLNLLDRLANTSRMGNIYPNQFTLKSRHEDFTAYAKNLTQHAFPNMDVEKYMPQVRMEIEMRHDHLRDVSEYRFFDFPEDIQQILETRIGTKVREMAFTPQLASFVGRRKYPVLLDPESTANFILPAPVGAIGRHAENYIYIDIPMDVCVHRRPPAGMKIHDVLNVTKRKAEKWEFLQCDHLLEREFKKARSGLGVTDEQLVRAYTQLGMFLYDLAKPFYGNGKSEPMRPARSKAAQGLQALLTRHPYLAPSDAPEVWKLAP